MMIKNALMVLLGLANAILALALTAATVFMVYTYIPKEILGQKDKSLVILFACGPSFVSSYLAGFVTKGIFLLANKSKAILDGDHVMISTFSCLFFYETCLIVGYICLCVYIADAPKVPFFILGAALGVGAFFGTCSGIPENI